ncbi:hypothetical protein [Paraglaciecola sp. T6c]|uniref:hypothetical protein n=1 Tax=Pseudoalteromonas atlantica (strain T6c / ATCC BAA-1087) TaxID=3042615 RepID=UPI00031DE35D|nr:hypothetical protein [Paraglaciecola sp. T6c]
MLKVGLLLCCVVWLLAGRSDSTYYLAFLNAQAAVQSNPFHFLYKAHQYGDPTALSRISQVAIESDNGYWLHFSKLAGSPQIQEYFSHLQASRKRSRASEKAFIYVASQGDVDAQVALYHHFIVKNQRQKAQYWLAKAAQQDAGSAVYYAEWLSLLGEEENAVVALRQARKIGSRRATALLNMIRSEDNFASSGRNSSQECALQLQMVAGTLHSVLQGERFKTRFEKDTRLKELPICINQPIWLTSHELTCSANWRGAQRLGCDITALSVPLIKQSFTHIVVLADKGKANVHNGIMFLDSKDDYNVFVHELAHFAGFVDEYPLSSGLANSICNSNDAPNLIVSKAAKKPNIKQWQTLGMTAPTTMSESRTCDNHTAQGYKPSRKMTFMEFYDIAYIPPYYLKVWAERLLEKPLLTPAYINLYQGYEAKGEPARGKYWRDRYQQYLQAD